MGGGGGGGVIREGPYLKLESAIFQSIYFHTIALLTRLTLYCLHYIAKITYMYFRTHPQYSKTEQFYSEIMLVNQRVILDQIKL